VLSKVARQQLQGSISYATLQQIKQSCIRQAMIKHLQSIFILILMTLALPATAQTSSIDDKVKYILEVTEFESVMDKTLEGFRPMMVDQIRRSSSKITPEIADHIANILTDEMNLMKPEFRVFIIDFYKKEFSGEEISALYEFYQSPIGSRVGRKMVKITELLIPQVQAFMTRHYAPRIQARLSRDERLRNALKP
jgi:hypothetical protein